MIDVFIGYDGKESLAYHVLAHSIMRRATEPVRITPLRKSQLTGYYNREDAQGSTDFSLTRFLVPSLLNYKGFGIFMDCDMLMLSDIADLWALRDEKHSVACVQHPKYVPSSDTKMNGLPQSTYPRKNWSSLMMFNAAACTKLTPDAVHKKPPSWLHRMTWANRPIGKLPASWNVLVGEQGQHQTPDCVHWTLGGPWWHAYADAPYADLWRAEFESMMNENGDPHAASAILLNAARNDRVRTNAVTAASA